GCCHGVNAVRAGKTTYPWAASRPRSTADPCEQKTRALPPGRAKMPATTRTYGHDDNALSACILLRDHQPMAVSRHRSAAAADRQSRRSASGAGKRTDDRAALD